MAKRLFGETQLTPTKNENKKCREGEGIKIQNIIPLISLNRFKNLISVYWRTAKMQIL